MIERGTIASLLALVLALGCVTNAASPCVPGEQQSCAECSSFDLVGVRVCRADGTFGPCEQCRGRPDLAVTFDASVVPDTGTDAHVTLDAGMDAFFAEEEVIRIDAGTDASTFGQTGTPCTHASDCLGLGPLCFHGFCSSQCDDADDDPVTRIDPACPGLGLCNGMQCFAACTARDGAMPCATGSSCILGGGCVPDAVAQCDVTNAASCGTGRLCVDVGLDPWGLCAPACDPFAPACDPGSACVVARSDGQAACFGAGAHADGEACTTFVDCAEGLGCHGESGGSFCRALCGGPSDVACASGTCVDFSGTIAASIVGACMP